MVEDFNTGFAGLDNVLPAVLDLLHNSRRKLDIFSRHLDQRIFAQPEVLSAIATLAQGSRHARVRILLHQPLNGGHQLVELQRRLSSKMLLRVMQSLSPPSQSFICGDEQAVVLFKNESQYEGFYRPDARAQAKRLTADFDVNWQIYSSEEADLRRLHI